MLRYFTVGVVHYKPHHTKLFNVFAASEHAAMLPLQQPAASTARNRAASGGTLTVAYHTSVSEQRGTTFSEDCSEFKAFILLYQ